MKRRSRRTGKTRQMEQRQEDGSTLRGDSGLAGLRATLLTCAVAELLASFAEAIRTGRLLPSRGRVVVAVSGGVDSVVLLDLFVRKLGAKRLVVAHFNHQLRGRSSDADERFVRRLAAALGVKCVVGCGDVRRHAATRKVSVEMAARELRHAFLAKTARTAGATRIALAHHADDQVELFFIRLLRGASPRGLGGMATKEFSPADARVKLVRPLLAMAKAELLSHATARGLKFREDKSNASRDFLRNRIRHELLPMLRKDYQSAIDAVIVRTMDLISGESAMVHGAAVMWLEQGEKRKTEFHEVPVGVQRAVIERQLIRLGIAPNYQLIERLRTLDHDPVTIAPGVRVWSDGRGLVERCNAASHGFNPNDQLVDVSLPGAAEFAGVKLEWRRRRTRDPLGELAKREDEVEFFDAEKIGPTLLLRHWRPGDRYQPLGMGGRVKLQDWFVNQKVSRGRRYQLVLAETAAGVLSWVEGQRLAEIGRVTKETRTILEWRWRRTVWQS